MGRDLSINGEDISGCNYGLGRRNYHMVTGYFTLKELLEEIRDLTNSMLPPLSDNDNKDGREGDEGEGDEGEGGFNPNSEKLAVISALSRIASEFEGHQPYPRKLFNIDLDNYRYEDTYNVLLHYFKSNPLLKQVVGVKDHTKYRELILEDITQSHSGGWTSFAHCAVSYFMEVYYFYEDELNLLLKDYIACSLVSDEGGEEKDSSIEREDFKGYRDEGDRDEEEEKKVDLTKNGINFTKLHRIIPEDVYQKIADALNLHALKLAVDAQKKLDDMVQDFIDNPRVYIQYE